MGVIFHNFFQYFLAINYTLMPAAVMDVALASDANGAVKSQLAPPAAALLAELGESSRNLPNASSTLGTIQLGLREISKRAHELRKDLPVENNTKA